MEPVAVVANAGPASAATSPIAPDVAEPTVISAAPSDDVVPTTLTADEQHRLATVAPDPLTQLSPSDRALSWSGDDEPARHPLAADEWARVETGAPCACSGQVAVEALLEERGPGDLEYESEPENQA